LTNSVTRALKCALLFFNGEYNIVAMLDYEKRYLNSALDLTNEIMGAMIEVGVDAAPLFCAHTVLQHLLHENAHFNTVLV
jgi:hypothetical protein